jgi:hypothetical protein
MASPVDAQQTFNGGGAISVGTTQTTASSSTLSVSGASGSSIASISVTLNGLTTNGTTGYSMQGADFWLTGPGGQQFVLLGATGNGYDNGGLNNLNITVSDQAGASAPSATSGSWVSGTFRPSSYWNADGFSPPEGTSIDWPAADGTNTLAGRFAGLNPNGTWTLSIQNFNGLTGPVSVTSWSLAFTYPVLITTTTSLSTNALNNQTTPGKSVTLTATVSAQSTVNGGTVTFQDNGNTIACQQGSAVPVLNGSAACTTSFTVAGVHPLTAAYNGDSTYAASTSPSDHLDVIAAPTVTVTPYRSKITTAQALPVTVTVNGGSGNPIPTGSVTLSSGSYTSSPATLSNGSASIPVPAGSLAAGSATLSAAYTPDAGSATAYNSATGTAPVTVNQALGSCATANPNPNPNPESFAAVEDFDGDCKSDILWRNSSTQQVYEWMMNGAALMSGGSPGGPTSDWVIQGTGDFDGDGHADILWRNNMTGEVYLWLMNGSTIASEASLGIVSSDWVIQGAADFNGDGKADTLWRNSTTGLVYLWLMNGTSIASQGSVSAPAADWAIQGVGDFNGDGEADILWRNSTTGLVYLWLMNGPTITSQGSPGTVSADWVIQGVGDFDGDGKTDILWRNSTSGLVYEWLMNGTSIAIQGGVSAPTPDWVIQGAGDYNGDGKADILWRNSITQQVYLWLMNGAAIGSTGSLGTPDAGWQIAAQNTASGAPSIPQTAISVSGIQTLNNWIAATDTGSGSGGGAVGAMNQVPSPSHSGGQALQFTTSFENSGDERYSTVFGDDPAAKNFVWDGWIYLDPSASSIANLEMDMNQVLANGETVIYGVQCDSWSGTWDYTANAGTPQVWVDRWVHSAAPCNVQNWSTQAWHHVQVQYSRDDLGNVTYQSAWLDGFESKINATVPSAFSLGWGQVLLTNFQVDGFGASGSSTVYLDDLTITRW